MSQVESRSQVRSCNVRATSTRCTNLPGFSFQSEGAVRVSPGTGTTTFVDVEPRDYALAARCDVVDAETLTAWASSLPDQDAFPPFPGIFMMPQYESVA